MPGTAGTTEHRQPQRHPASGHGQQGNNQAGVERPVRPGGSTGAVPASRPATRPLRLGQLHEDGRQPGQQRPRHPHRGQAGPHPSRTGHTGAAAARPTREPHARPDWPQSARRPPNPRAAPGPHPRNGPATRAGTGSAPHGPGLRLPVPAMARFEALMRRPSRSWRAAAAARRRPPGASAPSVRQLTGPGGGEPVRAPPVVGLQRLDHPRASSLEITA